MTETMVSPHYDVSGFYLALRSGAKKHLFQVAWGCSTTGNL